YTIDENEKAEPDNYILIIKPAPDFLDHYSLNEIEKVDSVENGNVVTTRDNGVKHHEYVVLVPGQADASREIAYYDKSLVPEEQLLEDESIAYLAETDEKIKPVVGDIYHDVKNDTKAMIVAMTDEEVVFGHGLRIRIREVMDEDDYQIIYRFDEG